MELTLKLTPITSSVWLTFYLFSEKVLTVVLISFLIETWTQPFCAIIVVILLLLLWHSAACVGCMEWSLNSYRRRQLKLDCRYCEQKTCWWVTRWHCFNSLHWWENRHTEMGTSSWLWLCLVFSVLYQSRDWLWRSAPKWPIMCWVGC